MSITASDVMSLRDRTGAGMMDCKKALQESGGDVEKAEDLLRIKGMKSAEKKAGRETGEGRVLTVVSDDGRSGAMVAVRCETDFAAGTEDFQNLLGELCAHVAAQKPNSVEDMLEQPWSGSTSSVAEAIKEATGKLGENMQLSEIAYLENPEGLVGTYIHHNRKVGALVSVTTAAACDEAAEHLKSLGMHVAFTNPAALDRDGVPSEEVEREVGIYREEVKDKPEEIQDKIVQGKLDKFYAAQALVEQAWVKDDSMSVAKAMETLLGEGSGVAAFARFSVGE
ncbi:MAG: translation elongation factor Ts [Planctomycetota bacterium]|jgi:elongation factor Ts|nr:translation elongation factor Ts [Planctomycetota bacterium]MDP6762619.1 translation elongation factor Ts [Planctomycetota bacterium]MDP6990622.1 translation elongation factor Ts [Planctomycetota bacterium]